ncbi:MAG TPA: DNA polymerase III subunit gamma/tau [Candidatus Intestinimonas pullistercoris]|uniref:DNA-directed DNA polymerase n=1 Tax=Candidatus Intestinimonas pullistercoris TaxID=2838623 RepID=A0A9D2NYL1_9FIRM|nr:DNA polymerase III subunit gamma/tau [Candidatus Intestinimonas pullistercoris]
MYQALYRKWRPRTFDDVVGQAHITDTLKRQVASGRLSHAYLFTGTRGTGKTTCAKILARAVNCEHPVDGNPCNQCDACRGIENGSILDVLELDAASNNGVDQVRALRDEAVYTPAAVRKRVYIVDEVHMLSTAAFNALLKILEEPPEHLMFILATTELHKVPATIKSRCQQFSFRRILPTDIAKRLGYVAEQEGIDLTPEGAELLARLADGGLRDALSLLDQCAGPAGPIGEQQVLDALGLAGSLETARLLERVARRDTQGALEDLARLYSGGRDIAAVLGELSTLARDLLLRKTAPSSGSALLSGSFDETTLRRLSEQFTAPRLVWVLTTLQGVLADLPRSSNRRTDAELCLIRLCDESLDDSPLGLAARLDRVEAQLSGGLPFPAAPAPVQTAPAEAAPAAGPQEGAAAPAEEDRPPWEEPSAARPAPAAPRPAPKARTEPSSREAVRETAASRPAAAPPRDTPVEPTLAAGGIPWQALVAGLREKVPRNAWSFLGNAGMVQGSWSGSTLTLWVDDELVKGVVSRPAVLEAVQAQAQARTGGPVQVRVQVGKAPAEGSAPGASAAEHDNLDDLLALGRQFDNIIIKE